MEANYFTILYLFFHTSTRIHHRYTCVSHPGPPSLLPPHTVPLGHPSAPAPSILYYASNLDWWFISYMILYMFQCHSPKSSHPLPLPQSPKDCSIHLCLFEYLIYNRADFKGKWTVLFNFLPLRVILKLFSLWFIDGLKSELDHLTTDKSYQQLHRTRMKKGGTQRKCNFFIINI